MAIPEDGFRSKVGTGSRKHRVGVDIAFGSRPPNKEIDRGQIEGEQVGIPDQRPSSQHRTGSDPRSVHDGRAA